MAAYRRFDLCDASPGHVGPTLIRAPQQGNPTREVPLLSHTNAHIVHKKIAVV